MKVMNKDSAAPASERGPIVASLVIMKVVREAVPLQGGGSASFGQIMDDHLTECALMHTEVQEAKIEFSEEHWHQFAEAVRSNPPTKKKTY